MRPAVSIVAVALGWLWPAEVPLIGQDVPVFTSHADLVVLNVTVRDRQGTYVDGIPKSAFAVVEDGRAQTVAFFSDTDTPVTVGLLVDGSASMYGNRTLAVAGAAGFAEASGPDDELFALAFNERVAPALPAHAPFTRDASTLREGLERTIIARGRTALYDAISAGVDYLARGSRQRKALVVLSDGGDNASAALRDAAVRKVQESNAVVYTIALIEPGLRGSNPKLLEELAASTGGRAFRPSRGRDLPDIMRAIALELRHTYTVGYVSTNASRDGGYRRVRVVVDAPPGRPLVVRSRAGYVAAHGAPAP